FGAGAYAVDRGGHDSAGRGDAVRGGGVDIEAGHRVARLDQVLRHRIAHVAETDEADMCHGLLSSARAQRDHSRLIRRARSGTRGSALAPSTMARASGPSARTAAT